MWGAKNLTRANPTLSPLSVARRYNAEAEINQLQWSKTQPDWVAIAFDKKLQILRV